MTFEVSYPRVYPEQKPPGHQPAAPRYSLRWDKPISTLVSDYIAMQAIDSTWVEQKAFFDWIQCFFNQDNGPDVYEIMRCKDEEGYTNAIIIGYWTDPNKHARWSLESGLETWLSEPARLNGDIGYWREVVAVPYDRHETIYSAPTYPIGFSRTKGSVIVPITTNGYFGAARDRLPISAIDSLSSPYGSQLPKAIERATRGKHILATVPSNLTILRSGQYWEYAGEEQGGDYLNALQPKLLRGMRYLEENKALTGCLSMRVMTNINPDGTDRAETSVNAHFLSLELLEKWAASHETHLDIYKHAIAMGRLYKEKREVVTWHELFVLLGGNSFEYINCHPRTGIMPYAHLWQKLNS